MENLWAPIVRESAQLFFSYKGAGVLFVKKKKIITKTFKNFDLKKTLLTLLATKSVGAAFANRSGLTPYLICKVGFSIISRVSLRFYSFFKFYFFRGGLTRRLGVSGAPVSNLPLRQSLNDYFFSPAIYSKLNKNSRWKSMEEIINHFLFYSEGPKLPSGFSQGSVEAPKGHLGVSIVSKGGNKGTRIRIRSSIQVMAGQITSLVQGVSLGDFVVIVSGSNIVVGEIDR